MKEQEIKRKEKTPEETGKTEETAGRKTEKAEVKPESGAKQTAQKQEAAAVHAEQAEDLAARAKDDKKEAAASAKTAEQPAAKAVQHEQKAETQKTEKPSHLPQQRQRRRHRHQGPQQKREGMRLVPQNLPESAMMSRHAAEKRGRQEKKRKRILQKPEGKAAEDTPENPESGVLKKAANSWLYQRFRCLQDRLRRRYRPAENAGKCRLLRRKRKRKRNSERKLQNPLHSPRRAA